MTIDYINLHIAKQMMSLRSAYGSAATIYTVWNGSPLLITWNCKNESIMFDSTHDDDALDEEDKIILTGLIKEFYWPLYFG